ncbi:hypothetical protein M404DRAFT_158538 [Pisolithus tinctorius Marx 270]|uniref:G domain-containing protein n=1 Tax=Pisolithus tinctorius Marx 270 TaxID=870435 RepID=A0A0C3NRE2_PISTI|nr:hypothetical protein M404DRAFT_158538 [Pisolithus tinctorius Marx 270]
MSSQTGAGKSSLINRVFGVEDACIADDKPGEAVIEKELISPENDRFILHDSQGFEPAEGSNYDTVKSFIEARKMMPHIKDQLHAVWLCFPVPIIGHGERLLEDAAEAFLEQSSEALGNSEQTASPHPNCERGHDELTKLTCKRVAESFTSVSPVPFAAAGAQRRVPRVKIECSINDGHQYTHAPKGYWRALATSTNFQGFKMVDCLRVIHTDIISVWNFYDPNGVSILAFL